MQTSFYHFKGTVFSASMNMMTWKITSKYTLNLRSTFHTLSSISFEKYLFRISVQVSKLF